MRYAHSILLLLFSYSTQLAGQSIADSTVFRSIFHNKTITITTKNNKYYAGFVTYQIDKIIGSIHQLNHKTKTIYKTYPLSTIDATNIATYFLSSGIASIPPADTANWTYGFDGYTYAFEYSSPEHQFKRSFWCPDSNYHNSPYGKIITNYGCYVEELIDGKFKKKFMSTLKPGTYYAGGFAYTTITWPANGLY